MTNGVLSGLVALLALPGVAYRAGRYEAGAQSGSQYAGLRIEVSKGRFNVERIVMHGRCTAPGYRAFDDVGGFDPDVGGFERGGAARLSGRITKAGRLRAIYRDGRGGFTRVSGQIMGTELTVTGTAFSYYVRSRSPVRYSCRASARFFAIRL
jgi:hypothetical protein